MAFSDTIVAISTPPGKGGVAVIRISGKDAHSVAERIFSPRGKTPLSERPKRYQIYGDIVLDGEFIDDGMLTLFSAPNSYTGEDTAEISCHGGMLITAKVLEAAIAAGATPAERGEFTRRAFTNGKLSLTDAEAIGLLLDAGSEAQLMLSRRTSRDRLSLELSEIRGGLTTLLGSIYARIDYPDEDLGDFTDRETREALSALSERICNLISTYKTGRAVNEGIATVICGKANVGKSTLYNLIVGEDAAIVTDIPGTTRDVLSAKIPLGDVMLNLYDTAGIREGTSDAVEAIGIDRSLQRIDGAELIFALFDSTRPLTSEDDSVLKRISESPASERIAIITKAKADNMSDSYVREIESACVAHGIQSTVKISANESPAEAKARLTECITHLFINEKLSVGNDAIISTARQHASLLRARDLLSTAIEALDTGLPQDAVSSDIELALGAISELDGRAVSEEVVGDIFARFCVGK